MRTLGIVLVLTAGSVFAQESGRVDDCGLEPPGSYVNVPVPVKHWEPLLTADSPALVRGDARTVLRIGGVPNASIKTAGPLANKVIYLSPGHGFTWDTTSTNWRTQRGNTNGIVEDLVSIETLSQFVMPMLLNAGARVVPVRELDLNTGLVIVDDEGQGYVESGAGFVSSSLTGFAPITPPISGDLLPFDVGHNRLMPSASTNTASATYSAMLPADGYYEVAVSYTSFSARVTDAHYVVRHAGGESHFRVNQQRHGGTWVQLGKFYFRAGTAAQVVVLNDSTNPGGSNISLDAVKFGGGMGLIDRGGGVSGRPRFEESARYAAQFAGAPLSVWAPSSNTPAADRDNDVSTRSRFAAWLHEPGEDAIYVAWHTNAFNASALGTTTYVYGPNPPDGTLQFSGIDGGIQLATAVHQELINDFRQDAGWNKPTWRDRSVNSGYFGEINPARNNEMPSILCEVAFHDAAADATNIKEPGWRYIAARSIAQGIVRYFAQRDGVPVHLFPEPPTHLAAINQGGGEAVIRWRASPTDSQGVRGDAATGYRLYSSDDGLAWDDGVPVTGTAARVNIPASAAKFFRVTGTNAGGESFPSVVVGVRAPVPGKPLVLIVNGFDRLDAAIGKTETFASRYALGNVLRILVPQMNDGSAARLTGEAIAANDVGFDTAENDAVTSADVLTSPYQLLAWFVGRGKQGGAPLSAAEQSVIVDFRTRGLPVFFTGDGVGDAQFVTDVFTGTVGVMRGGLSFDGSGALMGLTAVQLDDGTMGSFNAGTSPTISATSNAVALAAYPGIGTAAIGVPAQTVFFGFPFESIVGATMRTDVMGRVLTFLAPAPYDGGVIEIDAGQPIDAGVEPEIDAGQPNPDDGGRQMPSDAGPASDGGVIENDGGITHGSVLALQGGGCSQFPWLLPALALFAFRGFRQRRFSR